MRIRRLGRAAVIGIITGACASARPGSTTQMATAPGHDVVLEIISFHDSPVKVAVVRDGQSLDLGSVLPGDRLEFPLTWTSFAADVDDLGATLYVLLESMGPGGQAKQLYTTVHAGDRMEVTATQNLRHSTIAPR